MPATDTPSTAVSPTRQEIEALLSAPFPLKEVRFKPAMVKGNRALALAYVDARAIQDRLDEVLGISGWQDEYDCLPDGSVVCRLRLRLGTEWITKMDVGGPSEQPDEGDRRKAAFSDALKRAAVKFGIGRYLYRLPSQWVDYDSQKRQFTKTPLLPPACLPRPKTEPGHVQEESPREPSPRKNGTAPRTQPKKDNSPTVRFAPAPVAEKTAARHAAALPANGIELQRRLYNYDGQLAAQGLCQAGDLVKHVVQAGVKAGHEADLATWSGPAISLAVEETRAFESHLRKDKPGQKEVA